MEMDSEIPQFDDLFDDASSSKIQAPPTKRVKKLAPSSASRQNASMHCLDANGDCNIQ